MARGLRSKPSHQAEDAPSEKVYDVPGLDYSQSLTWRPGKAIAVGDLLGRLQALRAQLSNFEDEQVDSRLWTGLAGDLAHANLLGHKDKGVRAWTISCIIDVLKICAPDAPFQANALKDIFTVIINTIIPALSDPTNAYNAQHVYILHSLSESQSILLLADVDSPDALITSLFANAFDIFTEKASSVSEVEISKSVEYHLKNLLSLVVDEVDLPQDVTDIIISQFLRVESRKPREQTIKGRKSEPQDKTQSTLLLKDYPPAYNIAKAICTTCQEKMTSQITYYFNAVIVDAGSAAQPNNISVNRRASGHADEEEEGLSDLRKAHRLLRELWRACPDVLLNVIPQIEAELQADSIEIRKLATETFGDLTAGIGIAGIGQSTALDPAAYPLPSIDNAEPFDEQQNPLLMPASPKPFAAVHRTPYQNFLGRRNDRSSQVREAWAEAASRILYTRAGGIGMSQEEQTELLAGLAQSLRDQDEHVRATAVRALEHFTYHGAVNLLGADGGLAKPESVFSALAERFTDRKLAVREEAISFAARLWGTASRDIENGNDAVVSVLGDLACRLFGSYYTNDRQVHAMLDKVLYEFLLPLSYPPIKPSPSGRRKTKDVDGGSHDATSGDPDAIRARRILTLVRSLDDRARKVFIGMQGRQTQMKRGVDVYLKACVSYNGGVIDQKQEETRIKAQLTSYIDNLAKAFPEPSKMSADLWKIATQHDRRNYQLIRFAMGAEYDYKTMSKAVKELNKRIREGQTPGIIDSIMALLYRVALIAYNRSHVPTIMDVARSDDHGLGQVAHVILREISSKAPEVLKSHIRALCSELEESAPSATTFEESGAADTLKACAQYARRYPEEMSKERKFLNALSNFALFSQSPRAAKHAVSILLTVADRKEMYAKDILSKSLKDCRPGSPNFLSRLGTISQVCKLAPVSANVEGDAIFKLTVGEILGKNRSPPNNSDENAWDSAADEETQAKELALRVLVNRCRALDDKTNPDEFEAQSKPVFALLMTLVTQKGEASSGKNTPPAQRNRLRLAAAKLILKLCSKKTKFEQMITPSRFNDLALIIINPPFEVRNGFVNQIKKYLGADKLNHRWFAILFLLAFEPDDELRNTTVTWLRSRGQNFVRQQSEARLGDKRLHQNVMEHVFGRLVSLMAHHPDYPPPGDGFDEELLDFSRYIVFYMVAVATEENLSLVFHIAQRVKQMRDNVSGDDAHSERLWVLSDLAQAVIRNYADMMPGHNKGANLLQTWPGNATMPRSLFKSMSSHEQAQQVAEKNYLPEETALALEKRIKDVVKELKGTKPSRKAALSNVKKRKGDSAESDDDQPKKKNKSSLPIRKTPKVKAEKKRKSSPTLKDEQQPSRKSTRVSNAVSYAEDDSDDDDEVMADVDSTTTARRPTRIREPSPAEEIEIDDTENQDPNADEELGSGVHVNGDGDDTGGHEEAEVDEAEEREPTPSPSPLKERENTPGLPSPEKKKGKAQAAAKSKAKASSAKSTPATSRQKSTDVASGKKGTVTPTTAAPSTRSTRSTRQSRG
ncbi:uncharacterized protein HMPREF1541_02203 [Cyphellophora europaea CBS 101466]|uniref:Sister chromatid cohesion protein PDS5 n=1 Tax=Cyphellophora europaea (strain CBS 101466) TaxID=1220924 RepID=W2S361_CYPE1|nr:uncharacterized protein HMPREF1541_02203 [Cyphellophora europaea CBS 101466]ETN43045.1 hypothetical protein HMPREF1541_02203 [Cyphellophora europaea CBS 101466]